MNVIFISPGFPRNYEYFCAALAENGATVLGIGDEPYDELSGSLKASLTEEYKVGSMENYDEMVRAVGFFTFKYGKIDWLESNNEYWLETDAALRTDFNIVIGLCVGHDTLFLRHSHAPTTVMIVKDRVLAHNPVAALYTANGMYSTPDHLMSQLGYDVTDALGGAAKF